MIALKLQERLQIKAILNLANGYLDENVKNQMCNIK